MKRLSSVVLGCAALLLFNEKSSKAEIHFEALEYSSRLGTGEISAKGNVKIWEGGQVAYADKIQFNQKTGDVHGWGNVLIKSENQTLFGQEIAYNFRTRKGVLWNGGVETRGQMQLTGKRIEKVDGDRYLVQDGNYSTCLNCPRSWVFTGRIIDITYDGYAFIHDAVFIANEVPVAYFPYIIFPVKVQRQSGLVEPRYNFSELHGFNLGTSYFWAMDRSYDSTYGYDWYSRRGHLLSGEGRWRRSYFEGGQINAFGLVDETAPSGTSPDYFRGSFDLKAIERFGQIRASVVSQYAPDKFYTSQFGNHLPGARGLPALKTELLAERPLWRGLLSGSVSFYQDMQQRSVQIAGDTLQPTPMRLPMVAYDLPSLPLLWSGGTWFRGLSATVGTSIVNFYQRDTGYLNVRSQTEDPLFDDNDMVQEGQRYLLEPRLTLPFTVGDYIFASSEAVGRSSLYTLPSDIPNRTAQRQELELNTRLGTSIERIYETDDQWWSAVKHSIDPYVRFRYTPFIKNSNHPLFTRGQTSTGIDQKKIRKISGFDEEDTLEERRRAGYEIQQRLIAKQAAGDKFNYTNVVTFLTDQDYDFLNNERPFTPLHNQLSLALEKWSASANVNTNVYTWNSDVSAGVTYTFLPDEYIGLGVRSAASDTGQTFEWNVALRVKFLSRFAIETFHNYSQTRLRLLEERYNLKYMSMARCWVFMFSVYRSIDNPNYAFFPSFKLILSEAIF